MTATIRPGDECKRGDIVRGVRAEAKAWKLAMTSGFGIAPWLRTVASGDLAAVERAIRQAACD